MIELFYSAVCDYCEQLKNKKPKYGWVLVDHTVDNPNVIHRFPVRVFETEEIYKDLAGGQNFSVYKVLLNDKAVFTTKDNFYSIEDHTIFHSFLDEDESIYLMDGARALYVEKKDS